MNPRARNDSLRAVAIPGLPSEPTAHISPQTVMRLKAACIVDAPAPSEDRPSRMGPPPSAAHRPSSPVLAALPAGNEPFGMVCDLAAGRVGTVYLAIDRRGDGGGKFVAVKRLHAELSDYPRFPETFVGELKIATTVDHPYVCKVIDFGRTGLTYYVANEFLHGEPVSKILSAQNSRLPSARPPRLIARLIANFAEGLHAIHSLSLNDGPLNAVHGDVTTRNTFVLYDGSVRVTDFGLDWAHDLTARTSDTPRGDLSYLSPEQVEGSPLDARSDVWSLGVVMWEMLSGQNLFRCGTMREAVLEISARRISAPSEHHPEVPPELDRIVLKALSRNRAKRYASARELSLALSEYVLSSGGPIGPSMVASWLAQISPSGAEHGRELLKLASSMSTRQPIVRSSTPPPSSSYTEADRDEGAEATTHIFAGALKSTLREMQGLPFEEPLEGVSLNDDAPVTRPGRRQRQRAWRDHLTPLVLGFGAGIVGLGLGGLVLSRTPHAAGRVQPRAPIAALAAAPSTQATELPSPAAAPVALELPSAPAAAQSGAPVLESDAPTTAPHALAGAPHALSAPSAATGSTPAAKTAAATSSFPLTGSVYLSTYAPMDVSEQGRAMGRAPGQFDLNAGSHTLVMKSGSDVRTMTIRVPAGSAMVVSVPKNERPSP